MSARKTTEVAVGVLLRPDGAVLLADRPAGKPYAGYWEFPGGKIEPGEDVQQALARELHEELGIDIGTALPWFTFEYDYPHAYVRLHFRRVFDWRGTPHAREGQQFAFVDPAGALPQPLLPAAIPALRWLTLPTVCLRSDAQAAGHAAFIAQLDARLAQGLRLLWLDEPAMTELDFDGLLDAATVRCQAHGAQVLVSRRAAVPAAQADGLVLGTEHLSALAERPAASWVGAVVDGAAALEHAKRIGCDFVVAGPVLPVSRAQAPALGWHGFSALAARAAMPMFAAGGLDASDLQRALQAGAHGIVIGSAG
jgi:8-oxo-dGTP diphosphatase